MAVLQRNRTCRGCEKRALDERQLILNYAKHELRMQKESGAARLLRFATDAQDVVSSGPQWESWICAHGTPRTA